MPVNRQGGNPHKSPRPSLVRDGVKKLSPLQRSGGDVVKVLQRDLFTLTTDDEKL